MAVSSVNVPMVVVEKAVGGCRHVVVWLVRVGSFLYGVSGVWLVLFSRLYDSGHGGRNRGPRLGCMVGVLDCVIVRLAHRRSPGFCGGSVYQHLGLPGPRGVSGCE